MRKIRQCEHTTALISWDYWACALLLLFWILYDLFPSRIWPFHGVSVRKVRFNRRFGHVLAITSLEATTSQCIAETLMLLSLEEDSEPTNLM
jgi:hypothetical protein